MDLDPNNPLVDPNWVREIGNAIHNRLIGRESQEIEKLEFERHRELMQMHRDGWKAVADSISGGLKLIAEAIRSR